MVPAFNEAETIADTVGGLRRISSQIEAVGLSLSIYVIDDGSADGTGDLARGAGADRVLAHRVNQGLGAAVRTGLRAAQPHRGLRAHLRPPCRADQNDAGIAHAV
ncbi:glycosyltransferase [Saliniramus fredricksonii]|uniref:glycosyltransferase n=1 Tax=Saliniramus fredricksonii TaxID=1653334 RepID=UPI003B837174